MPELPFPIKSSSLTYEPYQLSGESFFFWLWRVEIDGKLFSKTMSPIQASDARVERYGCTHCGVAGDGTGFYAVRRLRDRVLWIYEELLDSGTVREFENLPESYVFDGDEYDKALGGGNVAELPELTSAEMRALIIRYLPPASLALYLDPETSDDPRGSELLMRVHKVLSGDVELTEAREYPQRFIGIIVGLDLAGEPECSWFIGTSAEGLCVMFAAFPKLPCWICCEQIAAVLDVPAFKERLRLVNKPAISDIEIWEFLRAIESGSVVLTPDGHREPQLIYAGDVPYRASNGWSIVIFNDANEWDYIDEIVTSDGRRISYDEIADSFPDIDNYEPTNEISWLRYRIPGYISFRCSVCDLQLKGSGALEKHRLECRAQA